MNVYVVHYNMEWGGSNFLGVYTSVRKARRAAQREQKNTGGLRGQHVIDWRSDRLKTSWKGTPDSHGGYWTVTREGVQ